MFCFVFSNINRSQIICIPFGERPMLLEGGAGVLWTPMILKMVTELTQALAL